MNQPVLIACVIAIIIALAVTFKFKVNVGYIAFPLAFLLGGFGMGTAANTIITSFPVTLFVQIMVMTIFFGYAIENGSIQLVANRVVYWFRRAPALLPWVLYVLCFAICAIGCAPPAIGAALCAIAVGVHKKTGLNYYVSVASACWGAMTGGFAPNGLFSGIIKGLLIKIGGLDAVAAAGICTKVMWTQILIQVISLLIVYLYFKSYKVKGEGIEKPETATPVQKKTLIIVAIVVGVTIIVPVLKAFGVALFATLNNYLNITSMCTIGMALCSLLKVADDRKVLKDRVPWNMLLMIVGMTALVTIMTSAGLVEWVKGVFDGGNLPVVIIPVLVCLLAGIVSIFSDATSVVIPLFIPISIAISQATGVSMALLIAVAIIGCFTTGKSPLSTGGAMLIMFSADDERQHWFNFTFAYAMILLVLFSILTFGLAALPMW